MPFLSSICLAVSNVCRRFAFICCDDMEETVTPYELPEQENHSFFFINQRVEPNVEAKLHRHDAWELYCVSWGRWWVSTTCLISCGLLRKRWERRQVNTGRSYAR